MKAYVPLALSAILPLVCATPIEQRDLKVVVETVVEEVVVTVDITKTLVGDPPATSKHANHVAYHANNGAHKYHPPTTPTPAANPKPVEKVKQPPPPPPSSAPPANPGGYIKPEDETQANVNQQQEEINRKQKSADIAHQNQMISLQNGPGGPPPSQPTPAAPVVEQPPPQQSPKPQPSQPSGGGGGDGGGGGSCGEVGGSCSGDVTIYNDQGLGACGWQNDTNSDDFFALAAPMFGTYTNDAPGPHKNAFCGRQAAIVVNGKTFTGMLTDRCGGCQGQSIDLSQHLFSQVYPNEPPGNGRYHDVSWHFTSEPIFNGPS